MQMLGRVRELVRYPVKSMAGIPVAARVSVGLPRQGGRAIAEELYRGLREVADAFQTSIVGGDTNSWDGPLVISVTLLGETTGRMEHNAP